MFVQDVERSRCLLDSNELLCSLTMCVSKWGNGRCYCSVFRGGRDTLSTFSGFV